MLMPLLKLSKYIDGAQVINFDFAHAYIWNLGEVLIVFKSFDFKFYQNPCIVFQLWQGYMIIPQSHANSFKMIPSEDVDVCKFVDQLDQDLDQFMDRFKELFRPIWTSLWTSLDHIRLNWTS